ncbi:MAG: transglycosylase SLT domain-containing protein [Pyrinomonadaceae bacterium]
MSIIANKHRRFYRFASIFILTLFTATAFRAQSLIERHKRIRQAMDKADVSAALPDLEALRFAEPNIFGFNNYDYLLARISEQQGSTAKAAANYQTVLARNSMLRQYALWHLAHIARATGNLTLERDQLRRLIVFAPTIVLRDAAKARLAESFFESGDYASAIETLRPRTDPAYTDAPDREALALVGQAYYRNEMKQAARQVFNSLVARIPDPTRPDDYALAAARGLDALDADEAKQDTNKVILISENEHLQRANIYNFNREFEAARRHYLAITIADPQSADALDALYQIGRGFYQQRRFDEALQWFERVIEKSPEGNASVRDAFSFKASALARLKRTDEAVAAYQDFINRFPDAPDAERPYLNIIDALRDAGRDTEALAWVDKTRARFSGQNAAARALFEQARIHQGQGAWAAALADFDQLRGAGNFDEQRNSASNETSQSEIALMRGLTLEQLNRVDEAMNVYLSLPDGRHQYYGGRATRRLRTLALDPRTRDATAARVHALLAEARHDKDNELIEQARAAAQGALRFSFDEASTREALDIARFAYAALPAYRDVPAVHVEDIGRKDIRTKNFDDSSAPPTHKAVADELLFLGLYDEGTSELALTDNSFDDAKLALLFMRGDMAARAIRYAEPLWKNVPADYLLELAPRASVERLYPAPYKRQLLEAAVPRNLDPRFVLAIARQESRFQPGAKSEAAARGLLQFISSTSNDIATRLGVTNFEQDELYDPATILLFGSEYMKNLFRQFPDMPEAVAASYNGGEDNVARWVSRAHSNDPDRYVAEIGFAQSRDYVTKVLPNFWAYQTLYTEQLQHR